MKRSYLRLSHGHTHGRHFAMTHLDPLANHEVAKKLQNFKIKISS